MFWAIGHHLTMGIVGIDHVQLAMPSGGEDKAVAFYSGVLGISQVAKPMHLAKRGGCWFEDGPLKVHLGVEADFRPARKAHPALLVDGLGALDEPLEGYDRVYANDPFGNRLELLEPLG